MKPDDETIYNLADFLGYRIYRQVGTDGMATTGGGCVLVNRNETVVKVGVMSEEALKEKLIRAARRKVAEEHRRIADQNAATQEVKP